MRGRASLMLMICICIMLGCTGDQSKSSMQIVGSYDEYIEIAKQYYDRYKENLSCSEDTYVNKFIEILDDGGSLEDARLWAFMLNMKIIRNRII